MMVDLFALRRANGDWFAIDDRGSLRVPIFQSSQAAMVARSQDTTMECFRSVLLDREAFKNVTTTDGGNARFWLIADPLRKLKRGRSLERDELARLLQMTSEEQLA
jgi:hypothetical protein